MSVTDERLKTKTEGSELLVYTGLGGGLGYLKIEAMLKGLDHTFTPHTLKPHEL